MTQVIRLADSFALDKAGSNMEARIAIMAMTTSNSISVNAALAFDAGLVKVRCGDCFLIRVLSGGSRDQSHAATPFQSYRQSDASQHIIPVFTGFWTDHDKLKIAVGY